MAEHNPARECDALTLPLRVADLNPRAVVQFVLRPAPAARVELAADLGVLALKKLEFRGSLQAEGRTDWRLEGKLGVTAVQACVLTAEPVTTRIDVPVLRRFLREMPVPIETEAEIPDDDSLEQLGPVIDPGAVMAEALALALPDYPRAPGATLPQSASAGEERPNPFAALAALKSVPE